MNEEYLNSLYAWITSEDGAFSDAHTPESFAQKMVEDKSYAAKMYEWIVDLDPSFSKALPVSNFMSKIATPDVKKKVDMDSLSEGGSLVSPEFFNEQQENLIQPQDNTYVAPPIEDPRLNAARQAEKEANAVERADYMEAFTEQERQKEIEVAGIEDAQREGLWEDPTFAAKVNLIDENLVGQEDTDIIDMLRDKFSAYGLIFEESDALNDIGIKRADSASLLDDPITALSNFSIDALNYVSKNVGKKVSDNIIVKNKDGSKSTVIDLDSWTDAGETNSAKKLRNFISQNAEIPDEASVIDDEVSKSMRAREIRTKGRQNEDGSVSTVLFQSANIDGKEVVYPTLFPRDSEGEYGSSPDWWIEKNGIEAFKLAKERGEVFEFETQEEAQSFAEGSWKDLSKVDAEGQIFYSEYGKDYIQEKKRYEEYIGVRDDIDFIEDMQSYSRILPENEEQEKEYSQFFVNGKLRDDIDIVKEELEKKQDDLYDVVMDDDSQRVREKWDKYLFDRQKSISQKAILQNTAAKELGEQVTLESYKTFGVSPLGLLEKEDYTPQEALQARSILETYISAYSNQQEAAEKYEISQTYYDAKVNKSITKDFTDNLQGVNDEIITGYNRGLAVEVILMKMLGIDFDINDPELKQKAAEQLVEYTNREGDTESRVFQRYAQATGGKEVWDIIKNDPAELFSAWAFSSIAQLLPYGSKLVPGLVVAGAGAGAATGLAGGPFAGVTVPAGAFTGGMYGLRTGMALSMLALEYGNEMMEAITTLGYDLNDPDSVAKALGDQDVWDLGRERGLKRGIPIALVDFATYGAVGKVFKAGRVASRGKRVAYGVAERFMLDPASEALGETLAQINVGDEIDYKEIIAEAGGGIGNNSSYLAINTLRAARQTNNVELANNLADIDFMSREISTDTEIANWGNNMQKLGKIDAKQNQRIQENIGIRKEARNLLDVGIRKRKYSGGVEARVMTLLSAKEELSSTPNRRSVFSGKIAEINKELETIATTKQLTSVSEQTILAGTGVLGVSEQSTATDIRESTPSYKIGRRSMTKETFLEKINKMSKKQLKKLNAKVENDDGTLAIVMEKLLPLQETQTKVVLDEEGKLIDEEVVQGIEVDTEESSVSEEVVSEEVVSEEVATETRQKNLSERSKSVKNWSGDQHAHKDLPYNKDKDGKGRAEIYDITKPDEKGVVTAQYVNPKTKSIDVIVSRKNDKNIVGYTRVYEKGEPTNMFTAKMESTEDAFKNMITSAEAKLPDNAEVVEKTSISEGGLKVYNKSNLTEKLDEDGNVVTRPTKYSAATKESVEQDGETAYLPFTTTDKTLADAEVAKIKAAYPGINANIKERKGAPNLRPKGQENKAATTDNATKPQFSITIDLPVLTKSDTEINKDEKESLLSEVTDLETILNQPEGKVDFRLKTEEDKTPSRDEVDAEIKAINELESGNTSTVVSNNSKGAAIDIEELGKRTTKKPKPINFSVIKGIPSIFTISDQLTTGDLVNPYTGNTINNLKGGIGYSFVEDAAWANTTEAEAQDMLTKAQKTYNKNKELFKKWWAANPEYNGLVPMNVVKMGEASILSNEATFRVLKDNLSKFPETNKIEALNALKKNLQENIYKKLNPKKGTSPLSVKNYAVDAKGFQAVLDTLNDPKIKSIEDVLSKNILDKFTLPTKALLLNSIGYGKPNEAGKKINPNPPKSVVPVALMKGQPEEMRLLLNLGSITDIITEPSIKNVPQRSIIAIQGVDVLNPKVIETNHPNYPYGVAGRSMGVLEESIAVVDAYPEGYNAALKLLVKIEGKKQTYTKKQVAKSKTEKDKTKVLESGQLSPTSTAVILTQGVQVQNGLPGLEFTGAVANGDIDNATKLISFLNTSFPSTVISTDLETFNNVINSEGVKKFLKGDEVIYGVTTDGDIYINPDVHNSESAIFNTAIHEMGHVWTDYLQTTKKGKEIYNKGISLVKQDPEYQKQLKVFNGDSVKAANEALAILIGNKGQTIADASLKSKFEEWLLGMWKRIKEQFKMSKDLTAKEIQNLTLDEFIGTALSDIFNGKEIKLTDEQLIQLKNPDVAFSKGLSIDSIVKKGRNNGFSDASIREVLLGRGFKNSDIKVAMSPEYVLDLFTTLPSEFAKTEGGIVKGRQLFNEVRDKLNKWSVEGPKGGIGTSRTKTYSDIRQKGMELMKANEIFKIQPEQTQMEILMAFDRSLGIRANSQVSKDISAIRNNLKQRKISADNINSEQIKIKNFIRQSLPKSNTYTQGDINKLVALMSRSKPKDFIRNVEKVLDVVEKQRSKMQKVVVKDIQDLVVKKGKVLKTKSGKIRSGGLDAEGQAFFKAAAPILTAVIKGNQVIKKGKIETGIEYLNRVQASLTEINKNTGREILEEAMEKQAEGKPLTSKEESLLGQAYAFDTFSDLNTMSLEDTKEILNELKAIRKGSIAQLKSNRALRAEDNQILSKEANESIEENFPFLYDENGKVKGKNRLDQDYKKVRQMFAQRKIWEGLKTWYEQYDFRDGLGIASFFNSTVQNLDTFTNILDKFETDGFFNKNIYAYLNQMGENQIVGYYRQRDQMDRMANSIPGNTKGYKQFRESVSDEELTIDGIKTITKTEDKIESAPYKGSFNSDRLMRIYSLSKNTVQREKLREMGFSDDKITDIKEFIGPEAVQMADMMVEYLSDTYFDEVNDVYRQVNDVNLGYVNNYFPTRTLNLNANTLKIGEGDFSGIFNSEFAPALKERTDTQNDIDLEPSFINVVENHFQSMERFKAYAAGTQKLNSLMRNPAVNTLLNEVGLKDLMDLSINAAINPNYGPLKTKRTNIDKIMNRFYGFALAFKGIQALKQATSFITAVENYQYRKGSDRIRGVDSIIDYTMFMVDFGRVLYNFRSEVKDAENISGTFKKRIETGFEGEIIGLESGRSSIPQLSQKNTRTGRNLRRFKKAGAAPTIVGDLIGVMGYKATYNRDIKNGMSEAEALEKFNDFNKTQQSRRATDKNQLQLRQDFLAKAFTMFGSTLYLQMNKSIIAAQRIMKPMLEGRPQDVKGKDIRALALNYAIANVLFVAASNIAKFTHGDKDDMDEALSDMGDAMMGLNQIYQVPLYGAALEGFIIVVNGERRPSSTVVNPMLGPAIKMARAIKDDKVNPAEIIQPVFEMAIGAQIDPAIALAKILGGEGELSEEVQKLIGISKSYRPKK